MIQQLRARFWALIMPILIGIFLIIYAGMGLIYFQQQREQGNLKALIDQRTATVSQPVELSEEDKAKYEAAQQAIPTGLVDEVDIREFQEDVIKKVLSIKEYPECDVGIVSIKSNQSFRTEKVGESDYRVMPFEIEIEGEYDKVVAFISTLDSMPNLKTLVLEELNITIGAQRTKAKAEFGIYTLE